MANNIHNFLSKQQDQYNVIQSNLSDTMLTTDYRGDNIDTYHKQSTDYTTFIQFRSITLVGLKRYLENLIEVGQELGLWGLLLFAKDLRKKLKINQALLFIMDPLARKIFEDILQRLDCLVDDILKNLQHLNKDNYEILLSPKVMKLLDRIIDQQSTGNNRGRCIVFVERVYTATVLSELLSHLVSCLAPPWNTRLKVKHVTGVKVIFSDKPMTAKYQVKNFRP